MKSHLIAQALVASLLQGIGERHKDAAMIEAGEQLAIRNMMTAASAIGFTGTRRGMTRAQQNTLRSLLLSGPGKLHHGDCVGADAQAHEIAVGLGCSVVSHSPNDPRMRTWKQQASSRTEVLPLRNKHIVQETAFLIAAPAERYALLIGCGARTTRSCASISSRNSLKASVAF